MKQPIRFIHRQPVVIGLAIMTLIAGLILPFAVSVAAAAGDLDTTFGTNGKATTSVFNLAESMRAIAIQSDGKIIVAGTRINTPPPQTFQDVTLARFNPDGSLDQSFGAGGVVVKNFSADADEAYALGIQSDGKIVVGGYTRNGMGKQLSLLTRYTADGLADPTFGINGVVRGPEQTAILAIAIQDDDKIVWSGYADRTPLPGSTGYYLGRLNRDGSGDSSFNSGGYLVIPSSLGNRANAVAIQPDGKIIIGAGSPFKLLRFNADGTSDPSFKTGNDEGAFPGADAGINALALQPDGRIVAAGFVGESASAPHDFAIARYNSNGARDKTFNGSGKVTTDFFGEDDVARALLLQPDGRIVAVGYASHAGNYDFALARYNNDGSLDASFGTQGKVTTDFGGNDKAYAAALMNDGRIIAIGNSANATTLGALAGYTGAGFDLTLQDENNGNILQINSATGDYLFKNCAGILMGGTGNLTRRGDVITFQHNTSDHKVQAKVDLSTHKATATIKMKGLGATFSINDDDTTNNAGTCP